MGRQSTDFKQKIVFCAHFAGAWAYARIRVLTAIDAFISIRLDLSFEAASSWVTGTWSLFDFKGKVVQHMSKLSKQVSADAIRGVLGMLPTPATSDANDWACTQSVDLDETERMAKMVVDAGVSILITAGSFGEGASLTWSEHQLLTDCLVQSVGARSLQIYFFLLEALQNFPLLLVFRQCLFQKPENHLKQIYPLAFLG